jgi:DNA-nicking Smr family endonuclease
MLPMAEARPSPGRTSAPPDRGFKTPPAQADRGVGVTLDAGWDRRLRQGTVGPERSIDLHGHTLASAHAALDHALERAVADDVRVLLVVTGRAPKPGEGRRGLIRAAIGDWLGASRHASRIAAVRHAHPRHGGAGALYVVLRRRRS